MNRQLQGQFVFTRKTGEVEHLFFDSLKLHAQAKPNFSIEAIPETVLSWGSALLAPAGSDPCIAPINSLPLPIPSI